MTSASLETISIKMDKSYCLVCLCSSSDYDIHDYKIQCENFWALFEVSNIKLCFLCKRIAQHAEIFIQNVKSNQLLLQNCFGDLDTTIQEVIQARSSQLQTSVTLSQTSLESITLAEKDIIDVGSTCIEVKMRKPLAGNKDVIQTSDENALHEVDLSDKNTMMIQKNIKIELKEEVLDHSDGGFDYINEEFITPHIKEEDDFPLNVFQEELTVEAIKVKPLKPVGKNKTIKKEVEKVKNTQVDKELGIKKIIITKEECMEERNQQALDQVYINCTYKCVDCLKGFNFKAGYENHLKKHSEEIGEYMCDICKMRMESHEKMLEHKKYHRIRFQCIECGLVRISRSTVVDHYNAMHKKGESQFVCPYCLKSFKRQMSQRKHIRYTHQKKGRVMCAYCQKSYANKAVLKSHMMINACNHTMADQPDEPIDLMDPLLPSRSNILTEAQGAAASTSATPFAELPTITAPKSKAQKQREYRQRIAASRTPAQAIAARKSDAERQRICRLRKVANSTLVSGSLE